MVSGMDMACAYAFVYDMHQPCVCMMCACEHKMHMVGGKISCGGELLSSHGPPRILTVGVSFDLLAVLLRCKNSTISYSDTNRCKQGCVVVVNTPDLARTMAPTQLHTYMP